MYQQNTFAKITHTVDQKTTYAIRLIVRLTVDNVTRWLQRDKRHMANINIIKRFILIYKYQNFITELDACITDAQRRFKL